MANTRIEWTEKTWNPVTGCTKISAGCKHCYAERMAKRLQAMGVDNYRDGFAVRCHESTLEIPYKWHKPCMVFVNSMSDLFHADVPDLFICDVFAVMHDMQQHTFQVLTKRAERMYELADKLVWTENIWAGVTVESSDYIHRIDCLRKVPASVRFLSLEPLLGPIDNINLDGIGWVIVGGESGPGARPMKEEWVLSIRDQCVDARVPFFFKQWGGVHKKKNGSLLQGHEWKQYPWHYSGDDWLFVGKRQWVHRYFT